MTGFEIFGYHFAIRGLIAGLCIGISCSALGVVLVLRRLALIGDGLSHVTFFGAVLGLLLGSNPVYISLPVVMASSLLILKLVEKTRMYGDTAIGIVSTAGIAGGVALASIGGGFNVDIFGFLFGNILSVGLGELCLSIVLFALIVWFMRFYYREFLSVSFDEDFAKTSGINTARINTLLVMITSIAIVLAIKVTGAMLTSSLVIVPAVTAIQVARGFKSAIFVACAFSAASVLLGLVLSFYFNLPSGASIVLLNILFFLIALVFKRIVRFPRQAF
jgi:zinc transport system permease protein